jgi:hypothetical protein
LSAIGLVPKPAPEQIGTSADGGDTVGYVVGVMNALIIVLIAFTFSYCPFGYRGGYELHDLITPA